MAEIPHCSDISYNHKTYVTAISKCLLNFLVCMFACNLCFVCARVDIKIKIFFEQLKKTVIDRQHK